MGELTAEGHEETFGVRVASGAGYIGISICPNSSHCTLIQGCLLLYINCTSIKLIFLKK